MTDPNFDWLRDRMDQQSTQLTRIEVSLGSLAEARDRMEGSLGELQGRVGQVETPFKAIKWLVAMAGGAAVVVGFVKLIGLTWV